MKIPTNLKLSRHGVYYYRAIVPKHLKAKLGLSEIKRSLHTKEPILAKLYAQYLNLTLRTGLLSYQKLLSLNEEKLIKMQKMANNLSEINIQNIRSWTLTTPKGTVLEADPNSPEDLASAEKVAASIFGKRTSFAHLIEQDNRKDGEKIDAVLAGWISRLVTENHKTKTIDEYLSKVKKFEKHVKNIEVHKIKRSHIFDFVTNLSNGKITGKPLSPSSINKYIVALTSFFNQALRDGSWPDGKPFPTLNQRLKKTRKTKPKSFSPFEAQDLQKIFDPENINWKNLGGNDFRPHMLWLPLLALFTGARIEELCQLGLKNIYQDNDSVWIIDINEEEDRQLKTDASIRKTPLHPTLIDIGFINYLNDINNNFKNEKLIFPYLSKDKYGKYSSAPSKWFGHYLNKLGITDKRKVFHSFRSTANNALKQAGITEEVRCQMIGHEYESTNSKNYSDPHFAKWLLENVIPKIHYPAVEFSKITYKKGSHVAIIKKLLKSKQSKAKHQQAAAKR